MKQMKCPKCGSTKVQLSNEESKGGCLWFILFGWLYLILVVIKWFIGLAVLLLWDWWMAILKKKQGVGYVYKCKGWFSRRRRIYYCHECNHNFRG